MTPTTIPSERSLSFIFTTFADVAHHASCTRWHPVSRLKCNVLPAPDLLLSPLSPTAGSRSSSHFHVDLTRQLCPLPLAPKPLSTKDAPTMAMAAGAEAESAPGTGSKGEGAGQHAGWPLPPHVLPPPSSQHPSSLPPTLRSRRPRRAGTGGRGGVASWGGRELLVLPILQSPLFAGLAHLCLRRRCGTSPAAAAGDEPDGARVLHPPPSPAPPHPRDDTPPPALSPSPTAANRPPLRTSTSSWLLLACVVASMAGARRPVPAPASRSCRGGDSAGRTWSGAGRGSTRRTCGGRARLGSGHGHGGPPLPPGHGRPPLPPCHGGARPSSLPHQRVAGLRELPPSPRPGRGAHGGGGGVGGSRWRRRRGAGRGEDRAVALVLEVGDRTVVRGPHGSEMSCETQLSERGADQGQEGHFT